jgi:O-antigen ligase
MTRRLDRTIFVLFLAVIAFTALALGTVEPWSVFIFELTITALLLLWALKVVAAKQLEMVIPITFWPILAFFVLGVIQCFSSSGVQGVSSGISIDAEATRHVVTLLFFLLASHLIAANFLAGQGRQAAVVKFLAVFGFVVAVFGLIQYFAWNGGIYWLRVSDGGRWVQGPFVNHNHFAGYMELLIPLPLALIATGAVKDSRVLYGFASVVMIIALVLSASRGGMISLAIALVFVAVCGFNFSRSRVRSGYSGGKLLTSGGLGGKRMGLRRFASTALILGSILAGLLWLGLEPVVNRLPDAASVGNAENSESFEASRGWIWRNSVRIFAANPILGTGMGTFATAIPIYGVDNRATYDGKLLIWDRAHNDYLQILTDTGAIGGSIALWFIASIIIVVKRNSKIADPFRAGIAIGCGGSILSILIHSVFDFNLQLPATSLLFLTLIAIAANLTSSRD